MFGSFGKKQSDAWMIVGLGNPGDEHAGHRHNIGFMAVDEIAANGRFPAFRSKFQSQMSEGAIDGQKVVLLKPQTYMNNSGQAVKAAAKFFKIPAERIVVFHDELDLAPGKVRVKCGGGNAGHNGLRSIEAHLGTADYWRVRLGIGHPGDKARVHGYVLKDFAKEEKKWLGRLLQAIGRHAVFLVRGDEAGFMTKIAVDMQGMEK